MTELDVRDLPPSERHGRIHGAFEELAPGETLTVVNDHDPKPLYHEMAAERPAFDADGYETEREGPSRFVAEFPKAADRDAPGADRARIADLDGDPHRVEAGEVLRFEGESAVEPTAREESVALVVLAPRPAE